MPGARSSSPRGRPGSCCRRADARDRVPRAAAGGPDGAPRAAADANDDNATTLHPARRGALFALTLAAIAIATRAAPSARAAAVCDPAYAARDLRTKALLREYCRLSVADGAALLTALCAGVTTLVTGVLALVVSRRKYDALLKSVLGSLTAVFLLQALTYAMEAPALGLSVAAHGAARPWIRADAAKYARWLFVQLWLKEITRHVGRLVDAAGRRARAQARGGGVGGGGGAAAEGDAADAAAPGPGRGEAPSAVPPQTRTMPPPIDGASRH